MTQPKSCPRCRRDRVPGFAFCGHCGQAYDASAPGRPIPSPAPSTAERNTASRITLILAGVLVLLLGLAFANSLGTPSDRAAGTSPPSATTATSPIDPSSPGPGTGSTSIAQASPAATAPPTAVPTPTGTPSPTEDPAVIERVGDPVLLTWTSGSVVQAQVIQELRNTGPGWARVVSGDYTIFRKDGSVAGTGRYTYAYPREVAPGGTSYLFDTAYLDGVTTAEISHAEVSTRFEPIGDPGPHLEITNVTYQETSFGEGVEASGVVRNLTDELARSVTVGVIFFGDADDVLGATYTNLVSDLEPGQRKGFETVGGSPPIERSAVRSMQAFGSIQDF